LQLGGFSTACTLKISVVFCGVGVGGDAVADFS